MSEKPPRSTTRVKEVPLFAGRWSSNWGDANAAGAEKCFWETRIAQRLFFRADASNRSNFTKYFGDGFVLTAQCFRRTLLMLREKIAVAAVTSSRRPNARCHDANASNSIVIDPVETGFIGAGL